MATSDLKIRVSADTNAARSELSQISNQLSDMNKMTFTKVAASFDVVTMAVETVAKGINNVINVTKEWINLYSQAQINETKLATTIKATGQQYDLSVRKMKQYASNLQNLTRFEDDAIIEAQSLLVATKKLTQEGIERTIEASADLAEALGTDITTAAQQLAKVLQDPTTGLDRLKQSGINFTKQEKEQIKKLTEANKLYEAQSVVLSKVEASYGGMAKAIANTDSGKLDQIKNVWGDIKEDLGKGLLDTVSPALDTLYNRIKDIRDIVDTIVNPDSERKEIISAIENKDLSAYTFDELKTWADEFRSDRNSWWAEVPGASGINPYAIKDMSAQQMWQTYGVDLSDARDQYFQYEDWYDSLISELAQRMLAEVSAKKARYQETLISDLNFDAGQWSGSKIDASTKYTMLNDQLNFGGIGGYLVNKDGTQYLIPIATGALNTGLYQLGDYINYTPEVESVASLATRNRANTIAAYDQSKGQAAQSYYAQMSAYFAGGANQDRTGRTFVWTAPEAEAVAIESVNGIAARNRINNIVSYDQATGKSSQSYYERMANYFSEGNNQDKTGKTFTWAAEESKSAFDQIKDNLGDLSDYAQDAFSSIATNLANMWTNQANNIKNEMESLRQAGALTVEQEQKMTSEMNELNRKAFIANKVNSIAEATTSYATGVMNIWKNYAAEPAAAAVMTGILSGTYATQLASIGSQQYTPFAKGGIVTGPTLGLVGEAGPEAIIPLKSQTAERMLNGNGTTVVINGNVYGDAEDQIFRAIERAQRTGALPSWRYA